MEKVRPWCGQPSDRGRLKNRTDSTVTTTSTFIIPTAPPTTKTSFFPSDRPTTNVVTGHTATVSSRFFGTAHTDHTDDTDDTDDSEESDQSRSGNQEQPSDSDNDMEMRTANIYPQNFRGVVSENADVWLKQFVNCCDDDRATALFRVLLIECAAV